MELMRQIYNGGGDDMLLDSPHGGSSAAQDSVFSCLESLAPGGGRSSSSGAARWVQLPADMCVTPLYRMADKEAHTCDNTHTNNKGHAGLLQSKK